MTNEKLEEVQKSGVPVNTRKNTIWALNVWNEWLKVRCSKTVEELEKEHPLLEDFADMIFGFGYQNSWLRQER